MNEAPMVMPTIAIALVRFSSVVRSATSARMTEPTAPAPCSARPTMTPPIEVDMRGDRTADREQQKADDDHRACGRRGRTIGRTGSAAGLASARKCRAPRRPDRASRPSKSVGIGGKHRIDHEQAEQPDGKDRRERGGGAKFLSIAWQFIPDRRARRDIDAFLETRPRGVTLRADNAPWL